MMLSPSVHIFKRGRGASARRRVSLDDRRLHVVLVPCGHSRVTGTFVCKLSFNFVCISLLRVMLLATTRMMQDTSFGSEKNRTHASQVPIHITTCTNISLSLSLSSHSHSSLCRFNVVIMVHSLMEYQYTKQRGMRWRCPLASTVIRIRDLVGYVPWDSSCISAQSTFSILAMPSRTSCIVHLLARRSGGRLSVVTRSIIMQSGEQTVSICRCLNIVRLRIIQGHCPRPSPARKRGELGQTARRSKKGRKAHPLT